MARTYRALPDLPVLDRVIERLPLADLPTPVRKYEIDLAGRHHSLHVKLDNLSSDVYGGNKVRKLEYILPRARQQKRHCLATFGTAGSHHALATAIYGERLGYPCFAFLSHQHKLPEIADLLATHAALGTRVVPYGGGYTKRVGILRKELWGRDALVVAPGGSSWLGTFAFVQAARELAAQVADGLLPEPRRLYIATGTMGSAAGLALGLALSELATEVHAVRVSHTWLCNEDTLRHTMRKATAMMRRLDPAIPAGLAERAHVRLRHGFFAEGYAHTDEATENAIAFARDQLDLRLEPTYTGKAMAALVHDLVHDPGHDLGASAGRPCLFWNSYNSAPLPQPQEPQHARGELPAEFSRYFS